MLNQVDILNRRVLREYFFSVKTTEGINKGRIFLIIIIMKGGGVAFDIRKLRCGITFFTVS